MQLRIETFNLLPKWVRVAIFAISLIVVSLDIVYFVYIFIVYYLTTGYNPPELEIIISLSLAQFATIAGATILYMNFSWTQVNEKIIMKQVSKFLTSNIPNAINNIQYSHDENGARQSIWVTDIVHKEGTTSAFYSIDSLSYGKIIIFVQVNIRIIEAIYYLQPRTDDKLKFDENVKNTIEGAKTVGWSAVPYKKCDYNGPAHFTSEKKYELVMMKQFLRNDLFLLNTPQKLFWANDLAMMTKSFLENSGHRTL